MTPASLDPAADIAAVAAALLERDRAAVDRLMEEVTLDTGHNIAAILERDRTAIDRLLADIARKEGRHPHP